MTRMLRRLRLWLWCLWHNARYGRPERWTARDTAEAHEEWQKWAWGGQPT